MTETTIRRPDLVLPARFRSGTPKRGMELVDLRSLGILPGGGGGAPANQRGYNAAADLVQQTSDGFDLNDLWSEYQDTMTAQNAERQTLIDFLTFPVTAPTERVPQISGGDFEEASEYGEPVGIRPAASYFQLGYDMKWYDLAARFTWKFLADAPRSQVDAINAMAIEADNRLLFKRVMTALFSNVNRLADINGQQDVNVYALYNGDGTVPPDYKTYTFSGTHTHYLTSGAVQVDSGDLDAMYEHLVHHGYSAENGMRIVLLANRAQVNAIRLFRVANGAMFDFIPAQGQPGVILPEDTFLLGGRPAASLSGINVAGSYGNVLVLEEDNIPAGYLAMIATGGRANLQNPVGIREHQNASLRGLRLVKGPNPDYPLIDSFYNRGFGTGIRHRGGSVIMQVTTSATYTPPAAYTA